MDDLQSQLILPLPDAIFLRMEKKPGKGHEVVAMRRTLTSPMVSDSTSQYPKLVVEHTGDNPFVGEIISEYKIDDNHKEIPGTRVFY